jgi:hypothetical protein
MRPKTQMLVNTELLNEKIEKSGLRIGFIVENLGISRQGFDLKRNGKNAFRLSEVYVLCSLLNITDDEEKSKIFYPASQAITEHYEV